MLACSLSLLTAAWLQRAPGKIAAWPRVASSSGRLTPSMMCRRLQSVTVDSPLPGRRQQMPPPLPPWRGPMLPPSPPTARSLIQRRLDCCWAWLPRPSPRASAPQDSLPPVAFRSHAQCAASALGRRVAWRQPPLRGRGLPLLPPPLHLLRWSMTPPRPLPVSAPALVIAAQLSRCLSSAVGNATCCSRRLRFGAQRPATFRHPAVHAWTSAHCRGGSNGPCRHLLRPSLRQLRPILPAPAPRWPPLTL